MAIEMGRDFGLQMHESVIKKGLGELNDNIHFDFGGRRGLYHPRISKLQAVRVGEKHVTSLQRGLVPEYNVYGTTKTDDGVQVPTSVIFVGWRHTFRRLVNAHIPGITWESLGKKFNVVEKEFKGREATVYDPQESRVI